MVRVLKPGGKLILIDMIAGNEALRKEVDRIETLCDPSHVQDLSLSEMRDLYESNGLTLITQERTDIPVPLEAWMELTNSAETIRKNIRELMNKDIAGCYQTGFSPYWKKDVIYFNQHWIFNMGIKQ